MQTIKEFYVNMDGKEANERRLLALDYCTQLFSLLKRGDYSQEDRDVIEKFITEGAFESILKEFFYDDQIRKKLINIRFDYKEPLKKRDSELGEIYSKYNMFDKMKNIYRSELFNGKDEIGFETYEKILVEYMGSIINPVHSQNTADIWNFIDFIEPEEYKGSLLEKKEIRYVKEGLESPILSKQKEAKKHIENYMGYLVSNGVSLDFENDPLLKIIPENELETVKDKFLIMEGVINGTLDGVMPDDAIKMAQYVLEVMQKKEMTWLDRNFANKYVIDGYFDTLMQAGINDKETRNLILSIRNKFINNKNKQIKNIYLNTGANTKIIELLKINILQYGDLYSPEELTDMVKDAVSISGKIDSPAALKMIYKLKDVLPHEEYINLEMHDMMVESAMSYGTKKMSGETRENLARYLSGYINDVLKYSDGKIPDRQTKNINLLAGKLLENIFENSKKVLNDDEKNAITDYMRSFYKTNLNDIWNLPETDKVFEYLIKIQKHSLSSSKKDGNFIKSRCVPFSTRLQSILDYQNLSEYETSDIERYATLLSKDGVQNSIPIKKCLDELKARGVDIYSSETMKSFIESFVDIYQYKKDTYKLDNPEPVYEIVLDYVENVTAKEGFKLYNEQGISDILQLLSVQRLPEEQKGKIYEILERNLHISQINPEKERENADQILFKYMKIENGLKLKTSPLTNEAELDEFLTSIDRIKLSSETLKVPSLLNKFLIAQLLYEDSALRKNPEKYESAVERIVEDFAFNDIETRLSQVTQRKVCYFTRDYISRRTVEGEFANGRIKFARKIMASLAEKGNISALETALHENTHQEQSHDFENGNYYNYNRYIMDKERVIRNHVDGFYSANYNIIFSEIEAREQAASRLSGYLKTLGVDLTQINVYNDIIHDDIIKSLEETTLRERANYELGKEKVKSTSDETKINVSEFFDNLIKGKPGILTENPILKLEYNVDGTLKTPREVCDYAIGLNEREGKILARNILLKGNAFNKDNLSRDIVELAQCQVEGEENTMMLGLIVADNMGRIIQEVIPDIEQMPLGELIKLQNAFTTVEEIINSGENQAFIAGFTRHRPCRPNEKNGQDFMTEANEKINDRLKEFSPAEIEHAGENKTQSQSNTLLQIESIEVDEEVLKNHNTKDEER